MASEGGGWHEPLDEAAEAAGATELAIEATARGTTAIPDPETGLNLAAKGEAVDTALAFAEIAGGAADPMMRLKPRGGFSKPLQRRTHGEGVLKQGRERTKLAPKVETVCKT